MLPSNPFKLFIGQLVLVQEKVWRCIELRSEGLKDAEIDLFLGPHLDDLKEFAFSGLFLMCQFLDTSSFFCLHQFLLRRAYLRNRFTHMISHRGRRGFEGTL